MTLKLLTIASLFTFPLIAQECCEEVEDWSLFSHRRETFFNTEFLFWTVNEGALDYAIRMEHPAWGSSDAFAQGDYKIAEYDWCPGFRISGGWYNEPHYWEVIAAYTWFYDKGHRKETHSLDSDKFINSTWVTATPDPLQRAKSIIDLHYHLGDLLATRVFDTNPHMRLRLIGGVTTAYIDQSWKVRYSNFNHNFDQIKNRWHYFGGGIRLGLSIDWYWTGCLYFTGKVTLATLMGHYRNRAIQRTNFNPGPDDTSIPIRDGDYEDWRFAFQAQYLLGPSYQRVFDCWHYELFAGYESNIWLNLQEVLRSGASGPSGPKETNRSTGMFGLQGLTARFTVGF